MRSATVRELRNRYADVLAWVEAGQEVVVTRRGRPVARLIPEKGRSPQRVSWTASPAVRRDRRAEPPLSSPRSAALRGRSSGGW